ncbi:hypothetical protein SAMN05660284_02785 [Formivibrio citricus]|uniref:Uncharacterized protein n=1 Tax=Formivibrio citricus TaxID=83765 RepID=A0A1I5DYJ8_9NEIS|nr:hypothetical protein SAMN05660284_02785 [Formivibrio citricus]
MADMASFAPALCDVRLSGSQGEGRGDGGFGKYVRFTPTLTLPLKWGGNNKGELKVMPFT